MTEIDKKNVWEIVKNKRLSFLSGNTEFDCDYKESLLSDRYINIIINSFAEQLEIDTNKTLSSKRNVSEETLQTAAEMFTYLNFCPSHLPKHLVYMVYIFKSGTLKDIIFALTSAIKIVQNSDEKNKMMEVLFEVMDFYKLNHYEKIQMISKGKCFKNSTFDVCTREKDINKDALKVLGFSDSVKYNCKSLPPFGRFQAFTESNKSSYSHY